MNKRVRRFLLQVFSSLNALFISFQPLVALPVLLSNPVVVQAESSVNADAVELTFDAGSHEFQLRVKTDQALPYVLTYVDESKDPVVEQAAQGNLEPIEPGVFGATVYAGTCSGKVCNPNIVNSGALQIGDQLKIEYRIVDGQVVVPTDTTSDRVCLAEGDERLVAGDTLWNIDEVAQSAETISDVKLGVSYQFPLDPTVSVTFTCLPTDESLRLPIKIQQILVSDLALPDTIKTDSKYAYDITTEMENGTFEYELTLPKVEGSTDGVAYIEKSLEEAQQIITEAEVIQVDSAQIDQSGEELKVVELDHFTIYFSYIDDANPPNTFNCTLDAGGPNDNPGQKDLNQMCSSYTLMPQSLLVNWNWDDTSWPGGNTGDACSLFDTDGDGFANYSLCVIIEGSPATYQSTVLYSCGDASANRCTNPISQITQSDTTVCTAQVEENADPFPGPPNKDEGDDYPRDTIARCAITMNDIGQGNATLIDVCSYPSNQPNSAPSDCIVYRERSGKLEVRKQLLPASDTGRFNLLIGSNVFGVDVGDAGTTQEQVLDTGVYLISETAGSNTNLNNYSSSIECRNLNGLGPIVSSVSDATSLSVTLAEDDDIVCTISNTYLPSTGTLKVIKNVVDASETPLDPSNWSINVKQNSNDVTGSPHNGSATGTVYTLTPGTYQVVEPIKSVSDKFFSLAFSGHCAPVAGDSTSANVTIVAGQESVCTLTNTRQTFATTVNKRVDTDGDGTFEGDNTVANDLGFRWGFSTTPIDALMGTSKIYGGMIGTVDAPEILENTISGYHYVGYYSGTYNIRTGNYDYHGTCSNPQGTGNPTFDSAGSSLKPVYVLCNARDTGNLKAQKIVDDGSDLTHWSFSLDGGTPVQADAQGMVDFGQIPTGFHSVTESGPDGYALSSIGGDCNENPNVLGQADSTTIKDGSKTCVFTNNRQTGQVTFEKTVDQGPGLPQDWSFAVYNANGGMLGDTYVSGQTYPIETGTYAVEESSVSGYSFDSASGICLVEPTNGKIEMDVSTDGGTCTINNLRDVGSVTVNKLIDLNGDGTFESGNTDANRLGFEWLLDGGAGNAMGSTLSSVPTTLGNDTYTIAENDVSGYHLVGWYLGDGSCENPDGITSPVEVTVAKDETTSVTFCNVATPIQVVAQKVICDAEQHLPNWGDDAGGQVTATTAQDYVDQSNGRCRLASDWDFEWGYNGAAPKQSGEYVGYAGGEWSAFDAKTGDGTPATASITNPDNKTLWFREVLQEGYIPFTYPPDASPGSNVSAEFYCNNDHYKYDNYESISNAQPGGTYYCVAFNAPATNDVEICKVDDQEGLPGWTVGLAKQTPEFSDVIPVTSGAGVDATLPEGDHVVFASGTYRYGSSAMIADAGFSYRPLSIPMGADGWVSGDQLTTVGGLELKVGGQNIAWGGYNPAHQYTTLVSGFAGGNLNLNIWDNQYGDNLNTGNFRAQVHQVATTGVTEDDGCVTLEDVPYGDYVAFELPQDNLSHVSTMVNGQNVETFPAPITVGGRDSSVTFENRLVTGQIRVQKTTDPAGDPTAFNVTAAGSGQVFGSATGSVTDATDYTYTVEPQTYSVSEDVPEGWELTSNNCSNLLIPSDGERVCQISNTKLYDIHGYKWNDVNRNAIDDQEARLPGWEIFIDQNDNQQWDDGEPKTTTSSDPNHLGWYWFENLYAGTYELCEILQDGWAQTYPVDPMCHTVALPDLNPQGMAVSLNMVAGPEYNFGNTQYGDVSVYKYEDLNTNGSYDSGEPLLPEWEMVLGSSDNGELRQTTNTGGNTVFDVLGGTYNLSETLQSGWYQSAISCDSNLGGVMITQPNYAYGHHGMCEGWNDCGDAATCALKACEANGYSTLVSYGDQRPCTEFDNCSLFYDINQNLSYEADWGNWCSVMGVTDIVCSNSPRPTITPAQAVDASNLLDKILGVGVAFAQEIAQIARPNSQSVTVTPGITSTCYVGNYQAGSISGAKYFDADQNGNFDENELALSGWGITITGDGVNESVVTNAVGQYDFPNLAAGTYQVCEEDRTTQGWISTEPINQLCQEVSINESGEVEGAHFGNFIDSQLYIMKTNDTWPTSASAGDEVIYTIKVMAVGGPVSDVTVTDLPPSQFEYILGSYTADLSEGTDLKGDGTTPDPNYQSPGVWSLGDLAKDEIITLTYRTKVASTADAGVYPDMVWATGTSEQSRATEGETDDLLALSDPDFTDNSGGVNFDGSQGHFGEDSFAGTQVAVVVDRTPFTEYEVAKTEEKQGAVLGATTELPATGARFWMTTLSLFSILGGAWLLFRKSRTQTLLKIFVGMLGISCSLWLAQPAQAVTSVRVGQPYNTSATYGMESATNQTTFKIDFTVLNTEGKSVTTQCQQQKNSEAWVDITTQYTVKAGGNSGYCEAKNLTNNDYYDFRVRVSGDGPDIYSSSNRVSLSLDEPGVPINYGKSKGNYCEDVIKFKTADDGKTVRVDVYRSTDAENFTVKPDTRVTQISIVPNQEYTLTTSKPDCEKTYYYAIRAFDAVGNASKVVGDVEITTIVIESEAGTTTSVALGALPASTSFVRGDATAEPTASEDTDQEDTGSEDETTATEEESEETSGTVLGTATETIASFLSRFGLPIGIGLIVLAGLYIVFFYKRNEK